MKLSSKSIFSPCHSREPPQMSLSSSFSRRLVNSGSIKGGGQASPMFPTVGRKRGPGFENPEPSSPKVTCIGQVRVKAKKQGKKIRGVRSKRSRSGGEASFRRTEQNLQVALNPDLTRQKSQKNQTFQYQNQNHQQQECLPNRNQRWVHLPLTICEALKGFGAEFSCFFPCCRSSCTREKEKTEDAGGVGRSRWLVTMQEGDAAKGMREMMGEKEEELEDDDGQERRHRRHVFEDIDIDDIEKMKNEEFIGKEEEEEEEEEEEKGRVSICIPPKNALLLMRCRSDPVKMAALANRFLEPTIHKAEDEDGAEEEKKHQQQQEVPMEEDKEACNTIHESEKGIAFVDRKEAAEATNQETNQVADPIEEQDEDANGNEQAETFSSEVKDEVESSQLSSALALPAPSEPQRNEVEAKGSTEEEEKATEEPEEEKGSKEREKGSNLERESGTLPECLLLMMCEPKLSVEVSKETWVCTADFIRWLPPRSAGKTGGGDRQAKKRVAVESKPPLPPLPPSTQPSFQPARSSCSFPAPVVGANGCESLVLTRCKSEPRESAAAKLVPEGCFWNNRKLMEPHAPARLGIGAAGVGF